MSAARAAGAGHLDFVLERVGDSWNVRGPRDRCGGVFASREAALDFVRREGRALVRARPYRPPGVIGRTA